MGTSKLFVEYNAQELLVFYWRVSVFIEQCEVSYKKKIGSNNE